MDVGIIGCNGRFGRWLMEFFRQRGDEVIGADIDTFLNNVEVVGRSDIVVFAVPINVVAQVMSRLIPLSRPDQLWLDITSVKVVPVEAMLQSRADVVGLHPMWSPSLRNWIGQPLIVCSERITWSESWLQQFLLDTEAHIYHMSPRDHDRIMTGIQSLMHDLQLINLLTLRNLNLAPSEIEPYASPVYRTMMTTAGRVLAQDAELYADIQFGGGNATRLAAALRQATEEVAVALESGDRERFISIFREMHEFLGADVAAERCRRFDQLIPLLSSPRASETL